ncbi:MAG: cadherin-like beta sandwich domain-containing protein [Betaproteobacteria bacterium]
MPRQHPESTEDLIVRGRRQAMGAFGALGAIALAACGGGGSSSSSSGSTSGASTVATLSGLTLSTGTLSPAFAAGTTSYTVSVSNSITGITLTPTASNSGATIQVAGTAVASGSASASQALAVGTNAISIVVTAADGTTTATYTVTATRAAATSGSCTLTATETDGPYPLYAILTNSILTREDITEGKTGVPVTLTLTLQDLSNGCTPISGAGIYIWHCDKDGVYSGYATSTNAGSTTTTFLRGVQVTDSNGQVTFTTIYPGWYAGRITHIHAQVYLNDNLESGSAVATTQLAFPVDVTAAVYASALYTKGQNTSVTSFSADNVFSDGTSTEMLALSGDTTSGYAATMTISIA